MTNGIGKKKAKNIFEKVSAIYGINATFRELFSVINQELSTTKLRFEDFLNNIEEAKGVINLCVEKEINIVNYTENLYPRNLLELKTPPVILYYIGNIKRLTDYPSVTVIGTREPTDYGIKATEKFVSLFVENNFNIVSGLAEGIDGVAHQATLESQGITFAVLAHGLNTPIYPKSNKNLADNIIKNNGAIISEYMPNARPFKGTFVERDRIQAALGNGIIVIEAKLNSGTMQTVKAGKTLSKDIGVFNPSQIEHKNNDFFLGNKKIIEEGGQPICSNESLQNYIEKLIAIHKESLNQNIEKKSEVYSQQLSMDLSKL